MNTIKTVLGTAVLAISIFGSAVYADVTFNIKGNEGQDSVLQVKNGIGKMTTPGDTDYIVFNSKTRLAVHADPQRGSYMEMSEADINEQMDQAKAMREQMAPQLKMMKEQMAGLDPATRKMLEQRMGGMAGMMDGAGDAAKEMPKPKFEAQGNKTIAGLKCQQNKVIVNGKHIADVCVMKSASGKVSKEDFATLKATLDFIQGMAKKASSMMDAGDEAALAAMELDGFPVSIKDKQGGDSYVVESVSDEKLSENIFTDYKKLQKKDMPRLMN
jgi:hypothetical protein